MIAAEAKVGANASAPAPAPWDPVAEGRAIMRAHPEVSAALLESNDAYVNWRFGEFFKARGLTPEQVAEFKFLWRTFYAPSFDLGGVKQSKFSAEDALPQADVGPRLRALLAPEGLRDYAEWDRTQIARDYAEEVASALCFTDTPLTTAQANQLLEAIAVATPKTRFSWENLDWAAADRRAQEILSPPQRTAWKNVLNLARANQDGSVAQKAIRDLTPTK